MLKNVKSRYILAMIFEYIKYKKKLNIIKYNNYIQARININLMNYKLLSGRYVIYQSDKKGKEYDSYTDKLIYEGYYLNGERNGKGKEYDEYGKLKFEGEYIKGKRNGEGKEYNYGALIFEGKYLNGKKNGIGKEFYSKGFLLFNEDDLSQKRLFPLTINEFYSINKIKYYGEYLNGKKWNGIGFDKFNNIIYELKDGKGFVKEYDEHNILLFEGNFLNGERNGKGKEYNTDGKLIFEGEYLNGKKWNKVEEHSLFNLNLIFLDKKHLRGKEYGQIKEGKGYLKECNDEDILIFEGEILNDERNGEGKEYNNKGILIFEGEYLNDKRNGKGKEYNDDGKLVFEGEYFKGHKKNGKEYINQKLEFEGEYVFDKKYEGEGYDEKGNVIYRLKNGNGKVREYKNNKLIFEGEYLNGKRHGKGKEFNDLFGDVIFEGEYVNGERKLEKNFKDKIKDNLK